MTDNKSNMLAVTLDLSTFKDGMPPASTIRAMETICPEFWAQITGKYGMEYAMKLYRHAHRLDGKPDDSLPHRKKNGHVSPTSATTATTSVTPLAEKATSVTTTAPSTPAPPSTSDGKDEKDEEHLSLHCVNISGLDKVRLLGRLWRKAATVSHLPKQEFSKEAAKRVVDRMISNFRGRRIVTDLSGDIANFNYYNSWAGDYMGEEIVEKLRKSDARAKAEAASSPTSAPIAPTPEPTHTPMSILVQKMKQIASSPPVHVESPPESPPIDISGLDKVELLRMLWGGASHVAHDKKGVHFDREIARAISKRSFIGYLCGRPLFVGVSGKFGDFAGYDHRTAPGTSKRIVEHLRAVQESQKSLAKTDATITVTSIAEDVKSFEEVPQTQTQPMELEERDEDEAARPQSPEWTEDFTRRYLENLPAERLREEGHASPVVADPASTIDISGLDKGKLLKELWSYAPSGGACDGEDMLYGTDVPNALKMPYIGWLRGRPLYIGISGDIGDFTGYDRRTKPGTSKRIVAHLRLLETRAKDATKTVQPQSPGHSPASDAKDPQPSVATPPAAPTSVSTTTPVVSASSRGTDIRGLHKVRLLRRLWRNYPARALFTDPMPSFDETEAKVAVRGYIKWFCGRPIHIDISGDTVDFQTYNRYYTEGMEKSGEDIVAELRRTMELENKKDAKLKGVPVPETTRPQSPGWSRSDCPCVPSQEGYPQVPPPATSPRVVDLLEAQVDISGLNKEDLLEVLWICAKDACGPAVFFDKKIARRAAGDFIPHLCGRVMEVDIKGPTANFRHYNNRYGAGKGEQIVASLRRRLAITGILPDSTTKDTQTQPKSPPLPILPPPHLGVERYPDGTPFTVSPPPQSPPSEPPPAPIKRGRGRPRKHYPPPIAYPPMPSKPKATTPIKSTPTPAVRKFASVVMTGTGTAGAFKSISSSSSMSPPKKAPKAASSSLPPLTLPPRSRESSSTKTKSGSKDKTQTKRKYKKTGATTGPGSDSDDSDSLLAYHPDFALTKEDYLELGSDDELRSITRPATAPALTKDDKEPRESGIPIPPNTGQKDLEQLGVNLEELRQRQLDVLKVIADAALATPPTLGTTTFGRVPKDTPKSTGSSSSNSGSMEEHDDPMDEESKDDDTDDTAHPGVSDKTEASAIAPASTTTATATAPSRSSSRLKSRPPVPPPPVLDDLSDDDYNPEVDAGVFDFQSKSGSSDSGNSDDEVKKLHGGRSISGLTTLDYATRTVPYIRRIVKHRCVLLGRPMPSKNASKEELVKLSEELDTIQASKQGAKKRTCRRG